MRLLNGRFSTSFKALCHQHSLGLLIRIRMSLEEEVCRRRHCRYGCRSNWSFANVRGVTAYSMVVFKLYLGQGDLKDRLRMGIAVVINGLKRVLDSKCPY